jgi:hypothetical protein
MKLAKEGGGIQVLLGNRNVSRSVRMELTDSSDTKYSVR